jgi:hypothetical protein
MYICIGWEFLMELLQLANQMESLNRLGWVYVPLSKETDKIIIPLSAISGVVLLVQTRRGWPSELLTSKHTNCGSHFLLYMISLWGKDVSLATFFLHVAFFLYSCSISMCFSNLPSCLWLELQSWLSFYIMFYAQGNGSWWVQFI